ncbi:DNA damage-regulated autophagy modulator protein 2 [Microcaecilia unicolor]|uniref:DNA damage-regulated autophagy modulator protein 2 n=1 Tax=Microcaecilia unicolor TaxID=1415580 RepID=A0A6P7ZQD6_9AMPH|nr:DNA damage-regulated autophagy modulator protein 2 [Microcaecilia unicolor]XP_030076962.1 DNA damage-regulated autophagy modulator protein 2 [Microcaecilia unicolor]XP_030076963.1 DNA damage-regulated autophagy modulator protein 2 [Microcaecilia unicolor]XP_030076964.1 DNA damage-regulated autophagy modulator protein 2 [Microcaecilia unicolor]XP_030076965.1 DNA damage-regulated autophagy modulator protein 2 [Microcaecilia unicolor]XP_030076966.1 DNA damage-regulated autophagy modulator prot
MWWFQQGLCFFPSALVVWSAATFIVSYVTAVLVKDVDLLVPYISDTGSIAPESCLFGVMLTVSAFLGVATMFVRYKQVEAQNPLEVNVSKWNKAGFALGMISCFGLCVVANFQKTVFIQVHVLGGILSFGFGALYISIQTILSYKMQPHIHGKQIFWVRLMIVLWCGLSAVIMFFSSVVLYSESGGIEVAKKLHWDPQEKGFTLHIISTVSEWFLAFSFIAFFLTYIRDFQNIAIHIQVHLQGPDPHTSWPDSVGRHEKSPLLAGSL